MLLSHSVCEIKLLLRNHWLLVLSSSIVLLFAFAIHNGKYSQSQREANSTAMTQALRQKDSLLQLALQDIAAGKPIKGPQWRSPSAPMTIGYRHPRLAVMPAPSLGFIAVGQSDMYTAFKSPTVYDTTYALDYAKMVNPVQLLFGHFDLAFVIIYMLPLIIIAFSFNVLSKEKELGTLKLLGAQPMAISRWLYQKMGIRFVLFLGITLGALLLVIGLVAPEAYMDPWGLLQVLALVTAYSALWFTIALLVNLKGKDSSQNAFRLIALWLCLVLIIPAVINQMGHSLYPTPSRLQMINQMRQVQNENESKQNEIMDNYLRTHPELAQANPETNFGFWHNYFAAEEVMDSKIEPLLAVYDAQITKQQQLISQFGYSSPAIVMQQSLNAIAGSSAKHYNDFKTQVSEFSEQWRNYLVPMLFKSQEFTLEDYNNMPRFEYHNSVANKAWFHVLVLLALSVLLLCLARIRGLKPKVLSD